MLLESLAAVESRYKELTQQIEENLEDYQKVAELSKERSDLDPVMEKSILYHQKLKNLQESQLLTESEDEEMRKLALDEIQTLQPEIEKLEQELKSMLVPKTRATNAMSSWKSGPAPAVMKRDCSQPICSACKPDMPIPKDGRSKCFHK
jgi:protein subunit release factor A